MPYPTTDLEFMWLCTILILLDLVSSFPRCLIAYSLPALPVRLGKRF